MNTSVCVTFFAYVTNVNNKHSWGLREIRKTGIALSSKMHFFIQGVKNGSLYVHDVCTIVTSTIKVNA